MNPLAPPWELGLETARYLRQNDFCFSLRENSGELAGSITAIGRDGDLPANPNEEAWVNAAMPKVPGMKQVYGADWTLPMSSLEAITQAFPAQLVQRLLTTNGTAQLSQLWELVRAQTDVSFNLNWKAAHQVTPGGLQIRRDLHGAANFYVNGHPDLTAGIAALLGTTVEARKTYDATAEQLDALVGWAQKRAPECIDYSSGNITLRHNPSSAG
jgi:hypothetical protein